MSSQPKGMKQPTSGVSAPIETPSGRKVYNILGNTFEVPPHYSVTKAVGYGSYGFVCAAVDQRTNEKVAVKKCQNIFHHLGDAKRILREIHLLRFLNHPNVCSIKSGFAPDSKIGFKDVYLVFELFDTDLNTVIRSKQVLEEQHHKYFIYQLLCGLKYLHSAHIMHRDLKPANILVNLNCDLKICDFGLARGYEETGHAQELTEYVITRWYRPPELLMMSTTYDAKVDIWSAGCIFAELSNRKALFPGKDYLNQINLICDVLGTPQGDSVAYLKPEAAKFLSEISPRPKKDLAALFPNIKGNEGIDFVQSMLTFDPRARPTAEMLLCHPYLAELHDPHDEPVSEKRFIWELETSDLSEVMLRNLFWKDMHDFAQKENLKYKETC